MSVTRYLVAAVLAASAMTLTAPAVYADPVPPWSPESPDYKPSGTLTNRDGDRTETWTWEPGHQSYWSIENNFNSIEQNGEPAGSRTRTNGRVQPPR